MDYPQQLDLPFDNKERFSRSYRRGLRQSIEMLVFAAEDTYRNSEMILDLAEGVLEVAKRNHDNKGNRNILTKGSYEVNGVFSTTY